jgi:hypothetical protein
MNFGKNFKLYFSLILFTFFVVYQYKNYQIILTSTYKNKVEKNIITLETDFKSDQYDLNYDILLNKTPKKYAILSANLQEDYYLFNLPMVALAWRRIDYEPIAFIVYSNISKLNNLSNKTIEYLNKFKVKTVLIKSPDNYETTVGMLSRLYGGLLKSISDDDFLITSDSDLYPINNVYYNIKITNSIKTWNAFCCGQFMFNQTEYTMYPLSHIGMRKFQWKEVMHVSEELGYKLNGESILKNIKLFDEKYIKKNNEFGKGDSIW